MLFSFRYYDGALSWRWCQKDITLKYSTHSNPKAKYIKPVEDNALHWKCVFDVPLHHEIMNFSTIYGQDLNVSCFYIFKFLQKMNCNDLTYFRTWIKICRLRPHRLPVINTTWTSAVVLVLENWWHVSLRYIYLLEIVHNTSMTAAAWSIIIKM